MIPVTKPFLPPQSEFDTMVNGIWKRNWLTNNGPLVNELENRLKEYLDVDYINYLGNGTIALQLAIRALKLRGDIITTPFSYVATVSSIVWEGCNPVFVDIDPASFNIDPLKIEKAITAETSAILATHVYGNPCDIDSIQELADKYNLKVIFDAAHCFGSKYRGKSVYQFGDISTASFHATKLFHTVEGGAVFARDADVLKRMAYMRNFGHDGPERFFGVGINGKNSEFHAAMGLCNLKYVDAIIATRKQQSLYYNELLIDLRVQRQKIENYCEFNYAYYPIVFATEKRALQAKAALEAKEIFPRRYFYPSLSTLQYVKATATPLVDSLASRILCLPLYHTLSREEQIMIARILLRNQNYPI